MDPEYEVLIPARVWLEYKTITDYNNLSEDQAKALAEFETLRRSAIEYCRYKYGAILRVGCYCCYGDGPNLSIKEEIVPDVSGFQEFDQLLIKCYVDFDFDASEYRDNK